MSNYIPVGRLRKPHGLSGAFGFILERVPKGKPTTIPHFFMEVKGDFLPFFIAEVDWLDTMGGYILFEEINSPELSKRYAGSALYIEESTLTTYFKKDKANPIALVGYILLDGAVEVGLITHVTDTPAHSIAVVDRVGEEVLIPIVEDWITEINDKQKKVRMTLPEGLYEP